MKILRHKDGNHQNHEVNNLEGVEFRLFPGEAEAIATACKLGEQYGYGNLIDRLHTAWSTKLQREYGMDREGADMAAGHICVWCRTDRRTGKKVKKSPSKKR